MRCCFAALLFACTLTALGADLYPTYVEILPGETIAVAACHASGFSNMFPRIRLISSAPEIAAVLDEKAAGEVCGQIHVRGVTPGTALLTEVLGESVTDMTVMVVVTEWPHAIRPRRHAVRR